jgi:hypothetical protein
MNLAISTLSSLSLEVSVDKTRIYEVEKGFIFLGFLFSNNGKVPCREAENNLSAKLTAPKYDDETEDEYNKRIKSVIRGWENYFYFDQTPSEKNMVLKLDENKGFEEVNKGITPDNDGSPLNLLPVDKALPEKSDEGMEVPAELIKEIDDLISMEQEQIAIRKIRFLLSGEYELSDNAFADAYAKLADLYEKQGLIGAADRCRKISGKNIANRYKNKDELIYGAENVEKWMEVFSSDSYILFMTKSFVIL